MTNHNLFSQNIPAEAAAYIPPCGSSSYAFPWLWHCRMWWSTGNTAGFHAGLQQQEIGKRRSVFRLQLPNKDVIITTLTGLNGGCRRPIQCDRLLRSNLWGLIWQSPSHHYLLYIQNICVHPGTGWSQQVATIFFLFLIIKEEKLLYRLYHKSLNRRWK